MKHSIREVAVVVVTIVAALALSMNAALAQQKSLKDRVVGTWKLISIDSVRPSGQTLNFWMGLHPTGLLIYQSNGYMAAQIMHDPRAMFATSPPTSMPTYDELKRAFFGYYAYWGTYTINEADSSVVHSVQGSLLPGEVGLNYKRFLSIEGTKLVVTTPTFKAAVALAFCRDVLDSAQIRDDEEFTNRLTFERATGE